MPLRQELGALDLARISLEHVDEEAPDDLALGLGVADAVEFAKKKLGLVGMDQRDVVVVAEHRHDLFGLVLAQKAMVDEDACQLIADRLVDQDRRDRTVDAARQPADHLLVADLLADLADRLVAVGLHRPVAGEAGEPHEVLVKRLAVGRVVDLGMELHGVEVAIEVGGDREGRAGRGAEHLEAGGDGGHMVAVAHPDLFAPLEEPAGQKVDAVLGMLDIGAAEFRGAVAPFDPPAQHLHHHLLAIADAKDRHAQIEHRLRRSWRAVVDHAGRATREDHRLRGEVAKKGVGHLLVGVDLAIDVQLAQATRDELGHLAAEVDDEKAVVLHHFAWLCALHEVRKRRQSGRSLTPVVRARLFRKPFR